MEVSRIENLPPPPGIINSIKTGFDLIAGNIATILFPLLLNLFLWLGPRLQMNALFNSIKDTVSMTSKWQAFGISAEGIQQLNKWYETANLFWLIFATPVGVSNLFANSRILQAIFPHFFKDALAQTTQLTPLGNPLVLQVTEWNIVGLTMLLILLGWILGGLYFRSVAWLAMADNGVRPTPVSHAIVQTILISISWGIMSVFVGMPFLALLTSVARSSNPFVAYLLMAFLGLASMWIIVPLYFWSHGIFLKQQNVLSSIWSSFQMARFTLPTSSMFVLTVFLLTFGLGYLWSIPPEDSWMMLVGILGHSFIATALLASSFVYYRDVNAWLPRMIEYLKSNLPSRVS
jgi:hypothetical protein